MEYSNKYELHLLKTEKGYLECVEEGFEEEFTENPLVAYDIGEDKKMPRYLVYMDGRIIKDVEEACEYLNAKVVKVNVEIITKWDEE